jgi:hypothetical protein
MKRSKIINWHVAGYALSGLLLLQIGTSLAQQEQPSVGSPDDHTVDISPGIGDRPIVREGPVQRYLAPKPLSPGTENAPFVRPKYYEAPVPPTEKYQSPEKSDGNPSMNSAPPGGRLKPLQ